MTDELPQEAPVRRGWAARARPARDIVLRYPKIAAAVAGAGAACGFEPLAFWPLTLVALACLMELSARATRLRGAFGLGWFFGLGLFTLGNNWIATAFTYQANMPAWLGFVAVVLLALYLAVYPALAVAAAWWFARRLGARRVAATRLVPLGLALAPAWIVTEWMRGWVFTGFAWNPLGAVLVGPFDTPGLAVLLPWLGTYALSGLVVLMAAALHAWARLVPALEGRARLMPAIGAVVTAIAVSAVMIVPATWLDHREGGVRFTLVQPDLRQEIIDDPTHFEDNFTRLADLSLPDAPGEQRVVFWPESGLGDYLRDGLPPFLYRMMTFAGDPAIARHRIGRVIGPYAVLLTGAVDVVVDHGEEIAARNTVTMLDGNGDILASYSKAHLVPYGEYLALRWLLEPLGATRLVAGTLDFWPGPGPRSFDLGRWGKVGVQICYEITFPGEVVDREDRPDYIFNPSNDGWFGAWGPPQHLAQARMRAIEEGLPVLRSTTTGISAVIDADGVIRASVPRLTAGRIDGRIPPPAPPTPFARLGNLLSLGWAGVLLVLLAIALRRSRS